MHRVNEGGERCETRINNAMLIRYTYLHDKALRKEDDKTKDEPINARNQVITQPSGGCDSIACEWPTSINGLSMLWHVCFCVVPHFHEFRDGNEFKRINTTII